MKHHIIYLPGLADHSLRKYSQAALIRRWRSRFGIGTTFHTIGWKSKHQTFQQKLQGVLHRIDSLTAQGYTVSLFATSAGAAMAIHAFAARPEAVHRVVVTCGALGRIEGVAQHIQDENPAFTTAIKTLPQAIAALSTKDRKRVLSIKPLSDTIVKLEYMEIPGINYDVQPTNGHARSIIGSLTTYSDMVVNFIVSSK